MSDPGRAPFFSPGGTLPPAAPSYIARQADEELYQSLRRGEFCYILTSRQMGKSSLMARTAVRLRESGVTVAIIDLSAIGHDANLTSEQWYFSLLMQIGEQLDCEEELEAFWQECNRPTPLQKWTAALRHLLILPNPTRGFAFPFPKSFASLTGKGVEIASTSDLRQEKISEERISFQSSPPSPKLGGGVRGGGLVIFIDEIDQVRALPFSTDEFFAAIRNSYNRRSVDIAFARLTFCLLGVALPSDLIRDPRLTPFNVGRRIELNDFTLEEALALEPGLGREEIVGEALLERVYFWTGGHPYLTQRLCQAIVETPEVGTPHQVDDLCDRLFLSSGAQEQDDNLVFVRDRLLRGLEDERELATLLTLYERIIAGKRTEDRKSDALVGVLRLSGIVRPVSSLLQVRNHIYANVFDQGWVREHMPGAELRRQRAAYLLGIFRATSLSALFLTAVVLGFTTFYQFRRAKQEQVKRSIQEQLVEQGRHLNYAADVNLIQQDYERGDFGRVAQLLDAHRPQPSDKEDLRGFEWRYFWRLMHQNVHTFIHRGKGVVFSVAFSPNGKILASSKEDGTIKLWDMTTWREITTLSGHKDGVISLAFSPNGKWLASAGMDDDKTVKVWDVTTHRVKETLRGHKRGVQSVAFSSNGRWLASGDSAGELILWDVTTWRQKIAVRAHKGVIVSVAFSPDGKWLASGSGDGVIKLWEAPFQGVKASLHTKLLYSLAFSPDSQTLAAGRYNDGCVEFWNLSSRRKIATLHGHTATVNGMAFSTNGRYLATGSWDDTIRLWDVSSRKTLSTFIGHTNRVTSVAFSPNGKWLVSGGSDEVKVWNPWQQKKNPCQLNAYPSSDVAILGPLFFSSNGTLDQVAIDRKSNTLLIWNCAQQSSISLCRIPNIEPVAAFSPNGMLLAIGEQGEQNGKVALWDVISNKVVTTIQADMRPFGNNKVNAVMFSPDGRILAVASGGPAWITLWDIASGRQIAHFKHTNAAQGIAFSPDGKTLAVANWQGRVYLWDIASGKQISWWAHSQPVIDVAFSPDGKTLATASEDATIKLWNVATQREMVTLTGPKGPATPIAFSPDGNRLAALSVRDKKVWVWEAASLAEADRAP